MKEIKIEEKEIETDLKTKNEISVQQYLHSS